jgi:hypothetical protein
MPYCPKCGFKTEGFHCKWCSIRFEWVEEHRGGTGRLPPKLSLIQLARLPPDSELKRIQHYED